MSPNVQYLTDDRGKRIAVLLPIAEYEKLVEDLHDLAVIAERRGEPTLSNEEFIADDQTLADLSDDDLCQITDEFVQADQDEERDLKSRRSRRGQ